MHDIQYSLSGVQFKLATAQGEFAVRSPLLGHFNVENIVAAFIAAEQAGFAAAGLIAAAPQFQGRAGGACR